MLSTCACATTWTRAWTPRSRRPPPPSRISGTPRPAIPKRTRRKGSPRFFGRRRQGGRDRRRGARGRADPRSGGAGGRRGRDRARAKAGGHRGNRAGGRSAGGRVDRGGDRRGPVARGSGRDAGGRGALVCRGRPRRGARRLAPRLPGGLRGAAARGGHAPPRRRGLAQRRRRAAAARHGRRRDPPAGRDPERDAGPAARVVRPRAPLRGRCRPRAPHPARRGQDRAGGGATDRRRPRGARVATRRAGRGRPPGPAGRGPASWSPGPPTSACRYTPRP